MEGLLIAVFLVGVVLFLIWLRRLVRKMPRESERESYRRWRMCTRKRAYRTKKAARQVVRRHALEGDTVQAYHCPICGRWHVGHASPQHRR
ncbi:hypothetical protein ACERK3_00880 [Phycisphaerales bacterium AB-hyl4]|uniref:Uncharacterized protein n=1 Tax=Natronomicrosphaera hydrolytica TaxID=3242702 RepID=A0ABV4TZR0_9BACT